VNADEIALEHHLTNDLPGSRQAQFLANKACKDYLENGVSFCFETVFSHESKLTLIPQAKEKDYEVTVIYIRLLKDLLNVSRVNHRVACGGHNVPEDKILSRIPRTHDLMKRAIKIVDNMLVLDNSDPDNPFKQLLSKQGDRILFPQSEENTDRWVIDLLS
jgi:predicted ABC-type ATPase